MATGLWHILSGMTMTSTVTFTETETFTVTHARRMASKVGTDLSRLRRLYGSPDEARIALFEAEVAALLKAGVLRCISYGFRKDGNWLFALKYHVTADGALISDNDPGKIPLGLNLTGVPFFSFLEYNTTFFRLSPEDQAALEESLPLQRGSGTEPGTSGGYWSQDLTYSAGGRALRRSVFSGGVNGA